MRWPDREPPGQTLLVVSLDDDATHISRILSYYAIAVRFPTRLCPVYLQEITHTHANRNCKMNQHNNKNKPTYNACFPFLYCPRKTIPSSFYCHFKCINWNSRSPFDRPNGQNADNARMPGSDPVRVIICYCHCHHKLHVVVCEFERLLRRDAQQKILKWVLCEVFGTNNSWHANCHTERVQVPVTCQW